MALGCHSKDTCHGLARHNSATPCGPGLTISARAAMRLAGCEFAVNSCSSRPDSKACILRPVRGMHLKWCQVEEFGRAKIGNITCLDC